MSEILSRVRKTLGEDALILSTRKRKRNTLGAFTEEVYEVSAAVDRTIAAPSSSTARRFIPPAYRAPVGGPPDPVPETPSPVPEPHVARPIPADAAPAAPASTGSAPFEAFLSLEKELLPLKEELRSLKSFLSTIAVEQVKQAAGARKDRMDELAREVRSLHDLLQHGAAAVGGDPSRPAGAPDAEPSIAAPPQDPDAGTAGTEEDPHGLDWLTRRLASQGVEPSILERIRTAALARHPAPNRVTEEELRREVGGIIESSIRVGQLPAPQDGGPRIIAFVGPTASGKTETVSRAARMLSIRGCRVAVVTVRDDRTGTDRLYERLQRPLGIPVLHAADGEALSRAVATCFAADYILIDVPGNALKDREAVRDLSSMFRRHAGIDFCLTLPVDWEGERADKLVEELSPLDVRYLAFTKMNKVARYGGMLNAAADSGLPVLFLSARRLNPARSSTFSRLLLWNRNTEHETETT